MQQLHPKAVWLFFLKFIFRSFFISFFIGFAGMQISLTFMDEKDLTSVMVLHLIKKYIFTAFIIFVVSTVITYIWAKLSYKYYKYELREEGFRKESGVIWKHYVTIPYGRIQNVDIFRGIFDRILGLSELHIQTAGMSGYGRYGGGAEGRLPGLALEDAEKLRDELIKRVRTKSKDQGL